MRNAIANANSYSNSHTYANGDADSYTKAFLHTAAPTDPAPAAYFVAVGEMVTSDS